MAKSRAVLLAPLLLLITCFPWRSVAQQRPVVLAPDQVTGAGERSAPDTKEVSQAEDGLPPGKVEVDGRLVLRVYERVGSNTPEQRAAAIKERVVAFARDSGRDQNCIQVRPLEHWSEIACGNSVLLAVTDGDARAEGKTREQLALEYAENIRQATRAYRQDHTWRMLVRGWLEAMLATAILIAVLLSLRTVSRGIRKRLELRIDQSRNAENRRPREVFVGYLGPVLLGSGAVLHWLLVFALLDGYLTVTLGFFPATRDLSHTVTRWVFAQLSLLGKSAIDYIPNALVIIAVALGVYYLLRLIHVLFDEIRKGKLTFDGFYPEWADPTEKLVRILACVLAIVVAFPYLPGAKSPAFQGISIFVGVLLSLGSSSAVANAVAGTILTYMRSFLVGDWVQMGETTGEVIEKNLLVTRILTPKAEIITIPNAAVMSGTVKNYSREAQKAGVIFYTKVTIGYDAPWRTVHQLLIDAALATKHILHAPPPFVLQRALDDFYVAYELNAYTDTPRKMLSIYSELHQNIQDKFNEASVEICSPHYASLRDGNAIAIPEQYVAAGQKPRSFQINTKESEPVDAHSPR